MNKKLIALAVGAAMAAPMAASAAPVVYGQLQAEIAGVDNGGYGQGGVLGGGGLNYPPGNRNTTGQSIGEVEAGQSAIIVDDNKRGRLGFKGTEDLGGNLKAIYKFEWQVETTTGEVRDGFRESFVGLKGGWGEVQVGSLKGAYKYTGGVKYDPLVATVLEARSNGGMQGRDFSLSGGTITGQHSFIQNSLSYRYKGKQWYAWANYAPDEAGGNRGRSGDINLAFKYFMKNWEAFVAYAKDDDAVNDIADDPGGVNPDTGVDQTAYKIGGQVTFAKAHRISLQYEQSEVTDPGFPTPKDTTIFLGYLGKFGKNNFILQAGQSSFKDVDLGGTGDDLDSTTYYALAWKYRFTKKTSAWIGYRSTEQKLNNNLAVTLIDGSTTDKPDATVWSLGMRVDF